MSSMSNRAIQEAITNKDLVIDPLNFDSIKSGNIDLTLASTIDFFRPTKPIDLVSIQKDAQDELQQLTQTIDITEGYDLQPGQLVKGYSKENIKLPSFICGIIFNIDSLASIGLNAALSQYVNPSFNGHKTIVLYNMSNQVIRIKAGLRICNLVLFKTDDNPISSDEHHLDLNEVSSYIDELEATETDDNSSNLDTSIADFMTKRIDEIVKGKA